MTTSGERFSDSLPDMGSLVQGLLGESDKLLLGLLNNELIGIYVIQNNQFRYVNSRFAAMFGYTQEELCCGMGPLDLTVPEYRLLASQEIERRIQNEAKSSHYSFESLHKDGSRLHIEVFGCRTELDGRPAIIGMLIDNTERRKAELEVKEQLHFTAQLIDAIPNPIFYKDEHGRYLGCNSAFEQMIGCRRDEILGKTVYELSPRELADVYYAADKSLFDNPGIQRYEATVRSGGGEHRDVLFNKATFNKSDDSLGGLVGIILDITERKHMENALMQREREYRTLVENTHDVVVRFDSDCRRIYVNKAWERVNGVPASVVLGKSPKEASVTVKSIAGDYERVVREVIASGQPGKLDLTWRSEEGELFCFAMTAIPEFDSSGKPITVLTVGRDITNRKRMEEELAAREQEWRTLVENSPDTIARYDRDCRRIYVNPAFCALTEGGADALLNKKPSEYPGGAISVSYEANIREVFATGKDAEFELNWKDKTGNELCSIIRLTPEKDLSGKVVTVMGVGHDISELNMQRKAIHQMAFYDMLTQLPNRRLFLDRLQHALNSSARTGQHGSLLFLDLDNFKTLNDSLGHDIGDMLLQQVAQKLTTCVRECDTVARIGGDEFVIIMESLSKDPFEAAAQTETVAEKILLSLNSPYRLDKHEVSTSSSIGITLFSSHEQKIEELCKQADIAMYQAKNTGRNSHRFFDPKMQDAVNARVALGSELRKAIENGEFQLHYQIQVDRSGSPTGAEALIRWIHPERGVVSPAQFIHLAEETGLMLPIGQWVLETACAQLRKWQENALTRNIVLAVNVSAKQFHQPNFVDQVREAVRRHAVKPDLLKLELTESFFLENIQDAIATMNTLKEIRIQFSLDDFGTGYSSLQYLKRLPLDQLKIDQSFVRDIAVDSSDKAIVSTVIAMAQSMNLDVIAEGVETENQLQFLQEKGCNQYQGYFFGKPVPIEQFEASLIQASRS